MPGKRAEWNNGEVEQFQKECVTSRKDLYNLVYSIFRKCVEETKTREELIQLLDDQMKYVLSKIRSERANELMEEMGSKGNG